MSVRVKAVRAALRLARKKLSRKKYAQVYKSVDPYNIRSKTDVKYKSKQKPKHPGGGGREIQTQKGSGYGIGATPAKINPKAFGAVVRRMPYVAARESWRAEMSRMFGGIHMSQTRAGTKKSVQLLAQNWKKRFKKKKIKKATEGGEVVVHHNVDRSLL